MPDTNPEATPEAEVDASAVGSGAATPQASASPARKRPKPGERRIQILQTLAAMLEEPGADRVTTAALAARIEVSEAALYRHFASKAQMFEGLIDFIEQSVFTLVNQIAERETDGQVTVEELRPDVDWAVIRGGPRRDASDGRPAA